MLGPSDFWLAENHFQKLQVITNVHILYEREEKKEEKAKNI